MVTGEQLTLPVAAGHWPVMAQCWNRIGPPLRPSPEDVAFYEAAVNRWVHATATPPRALILGVTPELYHLAWPGGTHLQAIDRTRGMIDTVWPGPRGAAVCADWATMPLPAHSRDVALCDAGFVLVPYPQGLRKIARSLRRVLAPGGLFVTRLFVPPAERESPDAVLSDLLEGRVASMNLLKLRLGMALHQHGERGVQLARVWDTLHRTVPNLPRLAERIGWPAESLSTIEGYRNSPSRYYFNDAEAICDVFCSDPGGFTCESVEVPGYQLGERCPTVTFRRGVTDTDAR